MKEKEKLLNMLQKERQINENLMGKINELSTKNNILKDEKQELII